MPHFRTDSLKKCECFNCLIQHTFGILARDTNKMRRAMEPPQRIGKGGTDAIGVAQLRNCVDFVAVKASEM
jgi:hypothetical protein